MRGGRLASIKVIVILWFCSLDYALKKMNGFQLSASMVKRRWARILNSWKQTNLHAHCVEGIKWSCMKKREIDFTFEKLLVNIVRIGIGGESSLSYAPTKYKYVQYNLAFILWKSYLLFRLLIYNKIILLECYIWRSLSLYWPWRTELIFSVEYFSFLHDFHSFPEYLNS